MHLPAGGFQLVGSIATDDTASPTRSEDGGHAREGGRRARGMGERRRACGLPRGKEQQVDESERVS